MSALSGLHLELLGALVEGGSLLDGHEAGDSELLAGFADGPGDSGRLVWIMRLHIRFVAHQIQDPEDDW